MDPQLRFFTSPPTSHILSSTPLSLKSAAESLSAFLSAAETNPRNHPSHQLTPQGLKFPQSAQSTSGADKLRVLGFIARGMAGEVVEEAKEVMVEMGEKIRKERDEGEFARTKPPKEEFRQGKKRRLDEEMGVNVDEVGGLVEEELPVFPADVVEEVRDFDVKEAEEYEGAAELTEEQLRQRKRDEKKARRKEEKKEKAKKRRDKS